VKGLGGKKESGERRFLFVAGNLALDFVNTEVMDQGQRADWLRTSADLAAWLRQADLDGRAGPALLRRAKTLRAALRRMAESLAVGRAVPALVVAAINRELREARTFSELTREGKGYEVQTRSDENSSALALVAQSAAELVAGGVALRVRKCGNPACILHFYDTTRSRTRRWCSMAGCGNRMKAAAHYRRRKEIHG
jgi:predicted RNA-binding Zn ribbon-like protein